MNELEAAFFYGDFRQLYAKVEKFSLENLGHTLYNISFVDEEIEKVQEVEILT